MVVSIIADKCVGCGLCASMCDEVFEMRDGVAHVKDAKACDKCDCKEIAASCPTQAIVV
ncbi:MAG: ferredoxin [Candidatus Aenigmarchaeota archaeon]|nr:ferredoxin [Candidatus Aenigmarchaeota archaeon]